MDSLTDLAVGVDIGGTFTDTVLMDGSGSIRSAKSATTPGALLDGLLASLSEAGAADGLDLEALLEQVGRFAHGTTAATNAFIERSGASVGLLATRGFEDVLFMQRMLGMTAGLSHSELTDYTKRSVPEPVCPRSHVFGIRERVDYAGRAIGRLREEDVREACAALAEAGVEAVAICFLWSFMNPEHERRAAEIVREEMPAAYVSVSSELVARLGEYERTATTVVNAYLGPIIDRYVGQLRERLGSRRFVLLDSGGGVMSPAEAARAPVRLLLSGPSGGVTGSRYVGDELGHRNIITFDMGGTSTDVGLIVDGEPVQRRETVAEKYHLLLPMVDIRAIGAGGGSVARVEDGGYLRVGPDSAGASPGPACYDRGGNHPTVTDADLVLGIIDPGMFLGGRMTLDLEAARKAIRREIAGPLGVSVEEAASGIKRVVDARMADLLRTATVEQGHDPRDFVLYAFGGAGPTHAPAFALELVDEVVIPASQSVHSAFGAIASDIALTVELASPMRLSRTAPESDADPDEIDGIFADHAEHVRHVLSQQGVPPAGHELRRVVEMRFTRQTRTLPIPYEGSVGALIERFLALYAARYSREAVPEGAGIELVTFLVEGRGRLPRPRLARAVPAGPDPSGAERGRRAVFDPAVGSFVEAQAYDGSALRADNRLEGPAIVEYAGTTVAVLSDQRAHVDELLGIRIRRAQ